MKRTKVMGVAVLSLLLGTTAPVYAQHEQQSDNQKQERRGDQKDEKTDKPKPDKRVRPVKPEPAQELKHQPQPQTHPDQQRQEQQEQQQQDLTTRPQRERAQQYYVRHLRQQQVFLNDHHPDYDHDGYYSRSPYGVLSLEPLR